jgi:UDP-2,3-diacylglucosamine hydrolase
MLKNLYYFVSDVHLGLRASDASQVEKRFMGFLNSLPENTRALYLLGDIFDFWYEYKYVIPRGHTRVLGKLAELRDKGMDIYFFRGNHDIWAYGYFEQELGIKVLEQPYVVDIEGQTFCLGHGDGLGYTPLGFKIIRWIFNNRVIQALFSSLHPRTAFSLGYNWSKHSRLAHSGKERQYLFRGEDEPIYKYASSFPGKVDHFIFGHFHTPVRMKLPSGGDMIVLGDWVHGCEYAIFDGKELSFSRYEAV